MFNFLKSERKDVKEYLKDIRNTQSSNSVRNAQPNSLSPIRTATTNPIQSPTPVIQPPTEPPRRNNNIYSQFANDEMVSSRDIRGSRGPANFQEKGYKMGYGQTDQYNSRYQMPQMPQFAPPFNFMYPPYQMDPMASQSYYYPMPAPNYQNPMKHSKSMSNVAENSQQSKLEKESSKDSAKSKSNRKSKDSDEEESKKGKGKGRKGGKRPQKGRSKAKRSEKSNSRSSRISKSSRMQAQEEQDEPTPPPKIYRPPQRTIPIPNPPSTNPQPIHRLMKPLIDEVQLLHDKKINHLPQIRRRITRITNMQNGNNFWKTQINNMDKLSKIIEIPKDMAEKHDSIMSMMEQLKIQLKL